MHFVQLCNLQGALCNFGRVRIAVRTRIRIKIRVWSGICELRICDFAIMQRSLQIAQLHKLCTTCVYARNNNNQKQNVMAMADRAQMTFLIDIPQFYRKNCIIARKKNQKSEDNWTRGRMTVNSI